MPELELADRRRGYVRRDQRGRARERARRHCARGPAPARWRRARRQRQHARSSPASQFSYSPERKARRRSPGLNRPVRIRGGAVFANALSFIAMSAAR